MRLVQVASQSLVELTVGSWFQSGSTLYVHPQANRPADAYVWAMLAVINIRDTGDYALYLENLVVHGGSECIRVAGATAAGGLLVCNGIATRYAQLAGNNIAVKGSDAILFDVDSSWSGSDGIGYHSLNGKVSRAIEINCGGYSNGRTGADQCSTMHDGGKIIRIWCVYRPRRRSRDR